MEKRQNVWNAEGVWNAKPTRKAFGTRNPRKAAKTAKGNGRLGVRAGSLGRQNSQKGNGLLGMRTGPLVDRQNSQKGNGRLGVRAGSLGRLNSQKGNGRLGVRAGSLGKQKTAKASVRAVCFRGFRGLSWVSRSKRSSFQTPFVPQTPFAPQTPYVLRLSHTAGFTRCGGRSPFKTMRTCSAVCCNMRRIPSRVKEPMCGARMTFSSFRRG